MSILALDSKFFKERDPFRFIYINSIYIAKHVTLFDSIFDK